MSVSTQNDTERYWLTCLMYVERNAVAAAIVDSAEHYHWSSYRVHPYGDACSWLVSHDLYDRLGSTPAERQAAYRAIYGDRVPASGTSTPR